MTGPIIHDEFDQLTDKWLAMHVGRPTASEFHQFMTPTFEVRTGEMFSSFVARKVAEKWRGKPLSGFSTFATEQGMLREDEALPWLMLEYDCEIRRVGFVEAADGRCGCSPDGLIEPDGGVEIKCPEPHTHVRYLLAGCVPKDYLCQVHGSLYVTGRKWWQFVSYAIGFPKLVLTVERNEEIMQKIAKALETFYASFDDAIQRITEHGIRTQSAD